MDAYRVVLYIHFVSLLVGVAATAVLIACALRVRVAATVTDAIPWGTVSRQTARLFPVAFLGLFGSGAYLTSDTWTWQAHWIQVGIAGLVLIAFQGALVAGPRSVALEQALEENGAGPLGDAARALARDRIRLAVTFANPLLFFAVVWIMTVKPETGGAIAALLIAEGLGILVAGPLSRS